MALGGNGPCDPLWCLAKLFLMKSLTEHLWLEVPSRRGLVNITRAVEDLVRKSGVKEGL